MADGALQGLVARLLAVPPEPEPPAGAPGSLKTFRAARGYYRYLILLWLIRQSFGLLGLGVAVFFLSQMPAGRGFNLLKVIEAIGILTYLLQLPFTFLLLKLDYRYRWYMVTDRSLRIREGIVRVREQTMSFANIQNMGIRQGPLQRLFGIADLEVRTAGGGEAQSHGDPGGSRMHTGYFRGVDGAAAIRDGILERLRTHRDAGLGDHDQPETGYTDDGGPGDADVTGHGSTADALLGAARELLDEVRATHAAVRLRRGPR